MKSVRHMAGPRLGNNPESASKDVGRSWQGCRVAVDNVVSGGGGSLLRRGIGITVPRSPVASRRSPLPRGR